MVAASHGAWLRSALYLVVYVMPPLCLVVVHGPWSVGRGELPCNLQKVCGDRGLILVKPAKHAQTDLGPEGYIRPAASGERPTTSPPSSTFLSSHSPPPAFNRMVDHHGGQPPASLTCTLTDKLLTYTLTTVSSMGSPTSGGG